MKKWLLFSLIGTFSLTAMSLPADMPPKAEAGANLLEQTSQAFTQIAEKTMPATVSIRAQVTQNTEQGLNPFDMFGDDFFRKFFGPQFQNPQQQPQMTGGSGFIVHSDGYIVTNNHVIKDATQIIVTLNDGREFPATVKGSDPRTDLAVLKIEADRLPSLSFGDSDTLKVGEWVVAIGNPFGLEATLTVGVVSAKGRQGIGIAPYEDFIQTDAAINPGNSGGPLLNLEGEVIGINTAIFSRGGGYMGIGFAIPSKMAQNVISQILNNGSVKRAYLGVLLQPVDKELADALGLEKQEGVLVSDVIKGSPAAKAGLQQGDIILQYNGKAAKNPQKLRNEIGMMNPDAELKLQVLRNNKTLNINVNLGEQTEEGMPLSDLLNKIGIEVENLTPDMATKLGYGPDIEGIVISKVKPGSPAAIAGLRPSFLITGVALNWNNQKKIRNTMEFDEVFKELGDKKHLILIVRHQNFQRYYTIKFNQ